MLSQVAKEGLDPWYVEQWEIVMDGQSGYVSLRDGEVTARFRVKPTGGHVTESAQALAVLVKARAFLCVFKAF